MSTESVSAPVALITGASKGIGLETARRLAEAGYRVYLTARSSERGKLAAEAVGTRFVQLEVTSEDSVRHAADFVEQAEGHLDVLVNNAGIAGPVRDVHDYTGDDLAGVLLTNVAGYLRVIHAFLPLLEKSDNPRIVNVSSGLGSFGEVRERARAGEFLGTPLYAPAKAAINMLTVQLAHLLPGIHINAADPGMTATDLSHGQGHSAQDGTDAILALALAEPGAPTGTFIDRNGEHPW